MKKLYVVGGGAFARDCACFINICKDAGQEIMFAGFLGHNDYGNKVDYKDLQKFYLGDVTEHKFTEDEYAVIGGGYPDLRRKIYHDLKQLGVNLYNLIMPYTFFNSNVNMGEGNIFLYGCKISNSVEIGNANLFNGDVIIGHDCEVGDYNFFGPKATLLGNSSVGDNNQLGANSILLPSIKIGNNNKLSPLSALYLACKDNCIMVGNPAVKKGIVDK